MASEHRPLRHGSRSTQSAGSRNRRGPAQTHPPLAPPWLGGVSASGPSLILRSHCLRRSIDMAPWTCVSPRIRAGTPRLQRLCQFASMPARRQSGTRGASRRVAPAAGRGNWLAPSSSPPPRLRAPEPRRVASPVARVSEWRERRHVAARSPQARMRPIAASSQQRRAVRTPDS
jgi:hypothetical protein